MMDFPSVDEQVLDAIGELTEQRHHSAMCKGTIEQSVGPTASSTPTVIVGRDLTTLRWAADKWTVVSFRCWDERLDVTTTWF